MLRVILSLIRHRRPPRARRLAVTLIEMIIVMILIATITGALALNYQKSLDRGRVFATEQKIERLHAILTMYFAQNPGHIQAEHNWIEIIENSGLAPPNAQDLLKDGWGGPISIKVSEGNDGLPAIAISSPMAIKKNIDKKS